MEEALEDILLRAAMRAAPNEQIERHFEALVTVMFEDNRSSTEISLALARGIVDGLGGGNWPTTVTTSP